MTELRHERSRLLERLTAEHPLVHDVDLQISDVQCLLEAIPQPGHSPEPVATSRQPIAVARRAQQELRRELQGLVDEAVAGSEHFELDCRRVESEIAAIEAQRAKAEAEYLQSTESLAAGAQSPSAGSPTSTKLAALLLACAFGLPLVAVAGRAFAQAIGHATH